MNRSLGFYENGKYLPNVHSVEVLAGYDSDDDQYSFVAVDTDGRFVVKNQVIDPDTLEWINQVQGTAVASEPEVAITNWPASQSVTGTFFQETQPVSGPLTDAQLRVADVKVTLDSEQVSVSNFPATQAVSLAEIPAGISTSANQFVLESLIETLQELTARLAVLASWNNAGVSGMRVVGVSMPSTAVTGPQTSAQFIATYNPGGANFPYRTAVENATAVLSNINNCVGA